MTKIERPHVLPLNDGYFCQDSSLNKGILYIKGSYKMLKTKVGTLISVFIAVISGLFLKFYSA